MQNKDGSQRRNHTDNQVIRYGGAFFYKGNEIDYIKDSSQWKLNEDRFDNISKLSIALSKITKDSELFQKIIVCLKL